MIYLIIFNIKHLRKWNSCGQFRMLHCLIIHFKSFHVRKKQFWSFFNHYLFCRHLSRITAFAHKFVVLIQKLLDTEQFQTTTKRYVLLYFQTYIIERFLSHAGSFTCLTFYYINQLSFKHQLHPRFEINHNLFFDQLIKIFLWHA